ncbi:helix-turn-helix domain-containing protein [Paenibacillus yanchengensis]|uniref:Helix-turn-helix domain-containing protein n=1 Tax=Paenibacillus yanchengensis TaxID=2035833 RepID=A0ABW4YLW5_9BACL
MSRLETINFQHNPFLGSFFRSAEHNYKGFFHAHAGMEILMIHEGTGSVTIPHHVYRLEGGSLFLFQPFQLHHVRATQLDTVPYVRSVLQFDPIALQPFIKPYKQLEQLFSYVWKGKMPQQAFANLTKRFPIEQDFALFHQNYASQIEKRQEHYALLVIRILQYLQQDLAERAVSIEATVPHALSHTEAILHWIEQNYMEPFELEKLANELHLSKYYISHLFREETGHTVTEYLLALRSKEACQLLLHSSLSVAEVGTRVGWPIPSHFIQQFKRWVGCTPLQYRKRHAFG